MGKIIRTAACLLVGLCLFNHPLYAEDLDTQLFRTINSNGSNPSLDSLMVLTSDGSIPFELGTTAALWFWGQNNGKEAAVLSGAALGISLVATLSIKKIAARPRPYDSLQNMTILGSSTDTLSFPSGHTSLAFSFAAVLSEKYRQWTIPLYGFASAVGFSRIYTGHHYPSDVLGGAITGYFCAKAVLANEDFFLSLAGLKKKKAGHLYYFQPVVSEEYKLIKVTCIF